MTAAAKRKPIPREIKVAALALILVVSYFLPSMLDAPGKTCVANLRQIDTATLSWLIDEKREWTETPTESELFGTTLYLQQIPECPDGGAYTLGNGQTPPTCSHPGHRLEINPDPKLAKDPQRYP